MRTQPFHVPLAAASATAALPGGGEEASKSSVLGKRGRESMGATAGTAPPAAQLSLPTGDDAMAVISTLHGTLLQMQTTLDGMMALFTRTDARLQALEQKAASAATRAGPLPDIGGPIAVNGSAGGSVVDAFGAIARREADHYARGGGGGGASGFSLGVGSHAARGGVGDNSSSSSSSVNSMVMSVAAPSVASATTGFIPKGPAGSYLPAAATAYAATAAVGQQQQQQQARGSAAAASHPLAAAVESAMLHQHHLHEHAPPLGSARHSAAASSVHAASDSIGHVDSIRAAGAGGHAPLHHPSHHGGVVDTTPSVGHSSSLSMGGSVISRLESVGMGIPVTGQGGSLNTAADDGLDGTHRMPSMGFGGVFTGPLNGGGGVGGGVQLSSALSPQHPANPPFVRPPQGQQHQLQQPASPDPRQHLAGAYR